MEKQTIEDLSKPLEDSVQRIAINHFKKEGMEILERDWITSLGVMDFIVEDEDFIAFVKVFSYPSMEERDKKIHEMSGYFKDFFEKCAYSFLKHKRAKEKGLRLDVLEVIEKAGTEQTLVRVSKDVTRSFSKPEFTKKNLDNKVKIAPLLGTSLTYDGRVEEAVEKFLNQYGMEVLERAVVRELGVMDFIAKDGEELVFVKVITERNPDEDFIESENLEDLDLLKIFFRGHVSAYLSRCDEHVEERPIRFDLVHMKVMHDNTGFIRREARVFSF